MLFNYHTHTFRCGHAVGEDRQYVESAIQAGLKTLGFADHAPYLFPDQNRETTYAMKKAQLVDYAQSVRSLAKEYANDIRILLGFEVEYYPDFHEEERAFLGQVSPDYLILGQHFIGNGCNAPYTQKMNNPDLLSAYVTQVIAGLATGDFLYLAHPDLPGWDMPKDRAEFEYRRLCEYAKKKEIPLEFNMLGFSENRCYPSREFLKIASEVGNKIIIGVDAHNPTALLDKPLQNQALALLKEYNLQVIEKPLI